MFGDNSEAYIEKFEEILETVSIDDFLEQEDLSVAEALYYLFLNGYVKDPFERL